MVKAASLVLLASGVSAFVAPVHKASRGRALKMALETEAGATPPLGYWDPLGLSADGDQEKFNRYRAAETKHGRIAQLAMLHYIVTGLGVKLPGLVEANDHIPDTIPAGFQAITSGAWPVQGWAQVLLFASALEVLAPQKPDRAPGDVQPDTPLFKKFEDKSESEAVEYINKELNNGRLAMVAVLGTLVQAGLTGGQHPFTDLANVLGKGSAV
jgi:hypothetical protein